MLWPQVSSIFAMRIQLICWQTYITQTNIHWITDCEYNRARSIHWIIFGSVDTWSMMKTLNTEHHTIYLRSIQYETYDQLTVEVNLHIHRIAMSFKRNEVWREMNTKWANCKNSPTKNQNLPQMMSPIAHVPQFAGIHVKPSAVKMKNEMCRVTAANNSGHPFKVTA